MSIEKSTQNITIGVSACLLGQKVRFDAGHKRDHYITDILGGYFKFVPVCPEIEVGMPTPRESVHLVGNPDNPRMVGVKSGEDWTDRMRIFNTERLKRLERHSLSGYILKKDSPSCGMERVRVYGDKGMPARNGRGMYASALLVHFPLLPVEEEGRLQDARLRENFIIRVFAYKRLQDLFLASYRRGDIITFHARHKYLLMAHSPEHYRALGQLVAEIKKHKAFEFRQKYSRMFMEALSVKTTARKNVNVLHHIMGYLKKDLDASEKKYILDVIEDYHKEIMPLIVPITLIRHYIEKFNVEYICDQIYLNPHPKELMLRNHV
jgi:uncharacterized protein YbgA (DUF1722 family)/uncharacterized protein YbbK (DUF523 family)